MLTGIHAPDRPIDRLLGFVDGVVDSREIFLFHFEELGEKGWVGCWLGKQGGTDG